MRTDDGAAVKKCEFVWLTCRLLFRAIKDAGIAAGVSFMLDPLFASPMQRLKIAIRNARAFETLLDIAMKNRVHRVWSHRYQVEGSIVGV